jgi:hypothetical protein
MFFAVFQSSFRDGARKEIDAVLAQTRTLDVQIVIIFMRLRLRQEKCCGYLQFWLCKTVACY